MMKLLISILFFTAASFSDNLPGTNVSSLLVPVSVGDTFHAVTWQKYHKGGWHDAGDTNVRNAIPAAYRDTGMIVHCILEGKTYQLLGGTSNFNWQIFNSGTSGAADSVKLTATYIGYGGTGGKMAGDSGLKYINGSLILNMSAARRGIYLLSNGDGTAFSDLSFVIKTEPSAGNVSSWIWSHRKDGYFSGSASGSLELYGSIVGGGYYAPICLKNNGDLILESANHATSKNIGIGTTSPTKKLDINGSIKTSDSVFVGDGSNYGITGLLSRFYLTSPHHGSANKGVMGYDYLINNSDSNMLFGYTDVNTHDFYGLEINEMTGKAKINLPLYAHLVGLADTASLATMSDSAKGSRYFAGQSYSTMFSGMQINRFTGTTHPDGGGEIYISVPSDFTPRIVSFSVLVKGDSYSVPPGETTSGYLYTCRFNSADNRFEIANDYSNSSHIRSKAITISTFAVTP